MNFFKKKLFLISLLSALALSTIYSDSLFNIKHTSKTSYEPLILIPKDNLASTHPRSPRAYIELSYFMYEPKFIRIRFICLKDHYDFDEAYTATMWSLEEFCIEYNFRKPIIRKCPSEHYEKHDGFEYVIYEAYVDLKPK